MMKLVVAIAMLGVASAQVQVSSRSNDLGVSRRQEVTFFEMSTQVAAQQTQIDQLLTLVNSDSSPLALGLRSIAADMQARTTGIVTAQAAMSTTVAGIEDRVAAQLTTAAAAASTAADEAAAAAATQATEAAAAVDVRIAAITASVNTQLAALTASVAPLSQNVSALTTAVGLKRDKKHIIWAGGCASSGGGGWHWYCLNRVAYNTAAGYFRKGGNEYMSTIKQNIFVKLTMWTITHGSGWNRMTMHVHNGQSWQEIMHSIEHSAGCWWKDLHGNLDLAVRNTNYKWRVRMHGACSHAFHSGGAEMGGNGYHSRFQTTYMGDM